jgi:hypothetical protein
MGGCRGIMQGLTNRFLIMANVINLNKKRKTKAKGEKEKQAEQNRIKFGRTKEQKQLEKLKADKAKRHIDGHKIDGDEE